MHGLNDDYDRNQNFHSCTLTARLESSIHKWLIRGFKTAGPEDQKFTDSIWFGHQDGENGKQKTRKTISAANNRWPWRKSGLSGTEWAKLCPAAVPFSKWTFECFIFTIIGRYSCQAEISCWHWYIGSIIAQLVNWGTLSNALTNLYLLSSALVSFSGIFFAPSWRPDWIQLVMHMVRSLFIYSRCHLPCDSILNSIFFTGDFSILIFVCLFYHCQCLCSNPSEPVSLLSFLFHKICNNTIQATWGTISCSTADNVSNQRFPSSG